MRNHAGTLFGSGGIVIGRQGGRMCREPRRRIWYRTAALEPGLGNRRTGIEPAGKANAFAIWNLPSDTPPEWQTRNCKFMVMIG